MCGCGCSHAAACFPHMQDMRRDYNRAMDELEDAQAAAAEFEAAANDARESVVEVEQELVDARQQRVVEERKHREVSLSTLSTRSSS